MHKARHLFYALVTFIQARPDSKFASLSALRPASPGDRLNRG